MRYLVTRKDLLGKKLKSSGDYLPKIVDAHSAQGAVEAACRTWSASYKPPNGREFLVIPLSQAVIVTRHQVPQYTYDVRPFGSNAAMAVGPDDEDDEDEY